MNNLPTQSTTLNNKFWRLYSEIAPTNEAKQRIISSIERELFKKAASSVRDQSILIREQISSAELASHMDWHNYPSGEYGGAFPLSQYSQENVVIVRASLAWQQKNYALPKSNPSFKKIDKILRREADSISNIHNE